MIERDKYIRMCKSYTKIIIAYLIIKKLPLTHQHDEYLIEINNIAGIKFQHDITIHAKDMVINQATSKAFL